MRVKKGSTDITVYFHLRDSSDGTSKTGLLYNSAGAVASYIRTRAARTAIALATLASASAAHSDGGFILVDDTNMKGLYRLDIPDLAVATGVDEVHIHIGFTGVFEETLQIELVDNIEKDTYDIVNHGSYGNAKLVRSLTPGNALKIDTNNRAEVLLGAITHTGAIIPWNPAWDTEVQSEVTDALVVIHLDHLLAVDYDPAAKPGVATALLNELIESDAGVSRYTANALEQGPSGATAAAIADAISDEALSEHQIQGTFGAAITMMAYLGPYGPGVYIDTGASNTGTILGEDGTLEKPVSTIAAATTIGAALGMQRFYLINNSSVTLAQTYEDHEFIGIGMSNQVTLGSQDVDNTEFGNVTLTGTQGGTQYILAHNCRLQALLSLEIIADNCWLTGDLTLRAATNQNFRSCVSSFPGNDTPDLNFPGSGTTTVNWRDGSGGLTVKNAGATDVMSYESDGQLVIDATCTSLSITVRGNCTITDNGTTTALTQSAAINAVNIESAVNDAGVALNLDHLMAVAVAGADIVDNSVIASLVSSAGTADWNTFVNTTDSLQAIRDVIGAAGAGLTGIPWNAAWDAEVESEVNDALDTAIAELGVATPASTPTIRTAIMLLYMALRNKLVVQTSGTDALEIHNDTGTLITSKLLTDDGSDYSEAKMT